MGHHHTHSHTCSHDHPDNGSGSLRAKVHHLYKIGDILPNGWKVGLRLSEQGLPLAVERTSLRAVFPRDLNGIEDYRHTLNENSPGLNCRLPSVNELASLLEGPLGDKMREIFRASAIGAAGKTYDPYLCPGFRSSTPVRRPSTDDHAPGENTNPDVTWSYHPLTGVQAPCRSDDKTPFILVRDADISVEKEKVGMSRFLHALSHLVGHHNHG